MDEHATLAVSLLFSFNKISFSCNKVQIILQLWIYSVFKRQSRIYKKKIGLQCVQYSKYGCFYHIVMKRNEDIFHKFCNFAKFM